MLHVYNARIEEIAPGVERRLSEELQNEAREVIQAEQNKYKNRFDKKRYVGVIYDVGEVVLVKIVPAATGQ